MTAQKEQQDTNVFDRLKGATRQPLRIINKTFLASLGLAHQLQDGLQSNFEKLAQDGEKVRDDASRSTDKFRNEIINGVNGARNGLTRRLESVFGTVLKFSPVATTSDIKELNSKLDEALRVAK